MAHVVESARPIAAAVEGLMDLIKDFNAARVKRREIKQTIAVLRGLTDRELTDMGITRGDIHLVATGQFSRGQ